MLIGPSAKFNSRVLISYKGQGVPGGTQGSPRYHQPYKSRAPAQNSHRGRDVWPRLSVTLRYEGGVLEYTTPGGCRRVEIMKIGS
jgi:hypothetical protein